MPSALPAGADGNSTAPSMTLTGLDGDELVFDNVFMGAAEFCADPECRRRTDAAMESHRLCRQSEGLRPAPKRPLASSVTMSWTASDTTARHWVIVAVPINPAAGQHRHPHPQTRLEPGGRRYRHHHLPQLALRLERLLLYAHHCSCLLAGLLVQQRNRGRPDRRDTDGPPVLTSSTLSNGWNLIGNPLGSSASLSFSSAGSSAFLYNATTKAYEPTTTLLPGQGAWVQGATGQTVTLTPSGG